MFLTYVVLRRLSTQEIPGRLVPWAILSEIWFASWKTGEYRPQYVWGQNVFSTIGIIGLRHYEPFSLFVGMIGAHKSVTRLPE